jgi:hypothetical protein
MNIEEHFFPKNQVNEEESDVLPEEQGGIDDFHLGRSPEIIGEERKAHMNVEDLRLRNSLDKLGLTLGDKGMLERIVERGREAFDGLLDVPAINEIAARFGTEFDQRLLNKSNERIGEMRVELSLVEDRIKLLNQMNEAADNKSGMADLLIGARNEKITEMREKSDWITAKIKEEGANAKIHEINRNRYVEWMIRRNNERIAPLEAEKAKHQNDLRKFDESVRPLVVHFEQLKMEAEALEKERDSWRENAKEAGMKKSEIRNVVKEFDGKINHRYKYLDEWQKINLQRAKIEQKIAAIEVNIRRADQSNEYNRILENKPLLMKDDNPIPEDANVNSEKIETKFKAGDLLELWREHFVQKVDKGFQIKEAVITGDSGRSSEIKLNHDEEMSIDEFKKRLGDYYEKRFPKDRNGELAAGIRTALGSFGRNEELLRAQMRDWDENERGKEEAPKLWIQDAIISWNNFISKRFGVELKNNTDLAKTVILSPGEFVGKDDVLQEIGLEELQTIVAKYYQNKLGTENQLLRDRLLQECKNFSEEDLMPQS